MNNFLRKNYYEIESAKVTELYKQITNNLSISTGRLEYIGKRL